MVSLMRLPRGYCQLRKEIGKVISAERKRRRMKQEVLADRSGIHRETLSRIEQGHRPPRPQVLDALMQELDLEWHHVAIRGACPNARPFVDGSRGDQLVALGRELKNRRNSQEKTLLDLAAELDISASTLSRLERGQQPRSRILKDAPGYAAVEFDSRRVQVRHPRLAAYLAS